MQKILLISLLITLLLISGCTNKNLYLPEAENDKIYTTVGGEYKVKDETFKLTQ